LDESQLRFYRYLSARNRFERKPLKAGSLLGIRLLNRRTEVTNTLEGRHVKTVADWFETYTHIWKRIQELEWIPEEVDVFFVSDSPVVNEAVKVVENKKKHV
jgi:hypothetical protein